MCFVGPGEGEVCDGERDSCVCVFDDESLSAEGAAAREDPRAGWVFNARVKRGEFTVL